MEFRSRPRRAWHLLAALLFVTLALPLAGCQPPQVNGPAAGRSPGPAVALPDGGIALPDGGVAPPDTAQPTGRRAVCGDRRLVASEECDDGNTSGGDGCAADCKREAGWACPAGSVCRAARCGDGTRVGREQCDDGNDQAGDGCGATCLVEEAVVGAGSGDGWICPAAGGACTRTKCGDGKAEGSEQCDDGNTDLGDGCTPFCRHEPACPAGGGACTSTCGDGLLLPSDVGQECDDGNTRAGDGCAPDCKKEPGYSCNAAPVAEDTLVLPIVYRDFKAFNEPNGHPDFERYEGAGEPAVVEAQLDVGGKPKHVGQPRNFTANNDPGAAMDYFAMWYRDTPAFNRTVTDVLRLARAGQGFVYGNPFFFPIDGRGFGNYTVRPDSVGMIRNFHFTSEIRTFFQYQGNERLDFTGDDDVWVFINKKLAVDLGGVHQELAAGVTLHPTDGSGAICDLLSPCPATRRVDLGLERGKIYEIAVFQAERKVVMSNYRLTLANFAAPRSRCDNVCGDGVLTAEEACDLGSDANKGAYGTCNADCTLPARCGDGVVQRDQGEACDGESGCPTNCRPNVVD